MLRKISFLLFFTTIAFAAYSQLIIAEDLTLKEDDLTAYKLNSNEPFIIDGDTIPYAIVYIGLAEPDVEFENRFILKKEFKGNEYWVYFEDGAKNTLVIKSKRYAPIRYKLSEPLQANKTYSMTIHKPDNDKYKGSLSITSNVPEAKVYVDGTKVSDGTPFVYTGDDGQHAIELRADGFDPQKREVEIALGQTKNININLFKEGSLDVSGISYGMVPVEACNFSMGGNLNYYTRPAHNVKLMPFSIGSTLVSYDLWKQVMGSGDERIKGPNGQVVDVTYDEIMDFVNALNEKTGKTYRLPSEAEWEYCAYNASKLGITDMGTGLEWCADWFGRYTTTDEASPMGPVNGVLRVVRGGTEYTDYDPVYNNISYRWHKEPHKSSPRLSFRLVCEE